MMKSTGKTIAWILDLRIKKWLLVDELRQQAQSLYVLGSALLKKEAAGTPDETFEQALTRLGLSEEELGRVCRTFRNLTILNCGLGLLALIYGFWLSFHQNLMGFCMSLAVVFLFASIAFKYHFWVFQIKTRKLGCTLKEWFHYVW